MRHLASMGFRLAYEQDPRTEFDFAVGNLGLDLRSGVRLLRVAELLTGYHKLLKILGHLQNHTKCGQVTLHCVLYQYLLSVTSHTLENCANACK